MNNRALTLILFLVECMSVLMCSLLAYGFFKTKGKYLKYIGENNCFPSKINAQVMAAIDATRQPLKGSFMVFILIMIALRGVADLWRKRKFLKIE